MTPARRAALIGAYATFAVFTVLAGQFWRNLAGWWGFGAIVALVVAGAIWLIATTRPGWSWRRSPKSTFAFLGLAALSITWSAYAASTALGLAILATTAFVAVSLALCLSWAQLIAAIANAAKWVLGLSLVFELVIALFVRQPVLPLFPDFDPGAADLPMAFYWSRGLLFEGGPIEGIVGNRNLLGMVALIGAIVFAALLAAGSVRRVSGIGWLAVAGLTLVLTRSSTVLLVALLVVVAVAFAWWARRAGPDGRRPVYITGVVALAVAVAALVVFWSQLTAMLGKSEDVTGRFEIWGRVTGLAAERPLVGWGWLGYWTPWAEPLNTLYERNGVTYLQAHNAWLDVWLQLGVVGLIAFGSIVVGALWRSWFLAVDQPMDASGALRPRSAISLVPFALMIALVGQSLAESRILIEGGLVLLLAIAWSTKRRQWAPEPLPAPAARPRFESPRPGTTSPR